MLKTERHDVAQRRESNSDSDSDSEGKESNSIRAECMDITPAI